MIQKKKKKGQEISLLIFVKHWGYNTAPTEDTMAIILRLPVAKILSNIMIDILEEGKCRNRIKINIEIERIETL